MNVYDDVLRKSLARRLRGGDVVDLTIELATKDPLLDLARSRLAIVLAHAGI